MEAQETCDFCNGPLADRHRHLLDIESRNIFCSCDECALLGSNETKKYKQVSSRYAQLASFQMPDSIWDSFMIPVGISFFFFSTAVNRITALYPSPYGSIESEHGLQAWQDLVKMNPIIESMQPDTEGLLVRRNRPAYEYYIVPIDEYYRLVGIMKTEWKGISGGEMVQKSIIKFFEGIQERSRQNI